MSLPVLKINLSQIGNNGGTLGFDHIVGALRDSNHFDIQNHNEVIKPAKGNRGTILYFNDKKIYLDFWEYSAPTHTMEVFDAQFDLIIKLQHREVSDRDYLMFCRKKKMFVDVNDDELLKFTRKIVPWTFFPSKTLIPFVGREHELVSLPIEQVGFFCGRNWKARHFMKEKLEREGIKYVCNEVEGARISDEEFMHLMLSSQFGIVLPGRNTFVSDCKNRREIDYMMMRKPLLISYRPYYYDPIIEGKHYILINDKTDFKNLSSMYNIEEMVESAYQWYQRNATPSGMVNSFMNIMRDKGYLKENYDC